MLLISKLLHRSFRHKPPRRKLQPEKRRRIRRQGRSTSTDGEIPCGCGSVLILMKKTALYELRGHSALFPMSFRWFGRTFSGFEMIVWTPDAVQCGYRHEWQPKTRKANRSNDRSQAFFSAPVLLTPLKLVVSTIDKNLRSLVNGSFASPPASGWLAILAIHRS